MKGIFSDECVFLLGAGVSADAGIPISTQLNEEIRKRLTKEYPNIDSEQRRLLNFLIGVIYYFRGISNQNPNASPVNVEEVISALRKLMNRDQEFISAFVGSWNEKLHHFTPAMLEEFERKLNWWVAEKLDTRKNPDSGKYLEWFARLYDRYHSTVHIFTLNHDLALELALDSAQIDYCTGFSFSVQEGKETGTWNPDLFDGRGVTQDCINVYKLHGSLGWSKDESGEISHDRLFDISDSHLMIFGILEKITIDEPFFELIKRFKERARRASLIVTIGYSFNDGHINSVLFDSLRVEKNKRLLIIDLNPKDIKARIKDIYAKDVNMSLIETLAKGYKAKDLFGTSVLDDKIDELLESVSEAPF